MFQLRKKIRETKVRHAIFDLAAANNEVAEPANSGAAELRSSVPKNQGAHFRWCSEPVLEISAMVL